MLTEGGLALGAALVPVLLPGFVAAAVGYLVFVGVGPGSGGDELHQDVAVAERAVVVRPRGDRAAVTLERTVRQSRRVDAWVGLSPGQEPIDCFV